MKSEDKKRAVILVIAAIFGILSLFFDARIAELIASIQNNALDYFFAAFKPMLIILMFLALAMILFAKAHRRKWAIPLGVSVLLALIASFSLKFIFMRERPLGLIENIDFTSIKDYSFPSTHAALAFAALPLLDRELPKLKYAWILISILAAMSRVYFNAHYLSDVIFGSMLGYLIGLWVFKISEKKVPASGKKK